MMNIIKPLFLFVFLLHITDAVANDPRDEVLEKIPLSLKNGTADYATVESWSKQFIEAGNYSDNPIGPIVISEKINCGNLHWILIKNTPKCGNVNCPYLLFSSHTTNNKVNYRYLNEIWFAGYDLFCYPNNHAYLSVSWHVSAAESFFSLSMIDDSSLTPLKKSLDLNGDDKSDAIINKLSTPNLPESELLAIFN